MQEYLFFFPVKKNSFYNTYSTSLRKCDNAKEHSPLPWLTASHMLEETSTHTTASTSMESPHPKVACPPIVPFKRHVYIYSWELPSVLILLLILAWYLFLFLIVCWGCRIYWLHLCSGLKLPSHNECPGYDIKQSDGETPALEIWGMWSTPLLLLLLGPL